MYELILFVVVGINKECFNLIEDKKVFIKKEEPVIQNKEWIYDRNKNQWKIFRDRCFT